MLIMAGMIEGFFSPSGAPVMLKFAVGGALFTLLLLWLFSSHEEQPPKLEHTFYICLNKRLTRPPALCYLSGFERRSAWIVASFSPIL